MTGIINTITAYCNSNPVVSGLIGLWGLTVLTFFVKTVPSRAIGLIKKHLTTTIYLHSYTYAYHQFMKWIDNKDIVKKFRSVAVNNGQWGNNEKHTKGVGYGRHLIFLKGKLLSISLDKEETDHYIEKATLKITKFGRSHKFFDKILKEINVKDDKNIKIYRSSEGNWVFNKEQRKNNIENICLEEEKRSLLFKTIGDFVAKKEWYLQKDIPHRLGILLYGPPGTGKTSLIKAIASYFGKNIYNMTSMNVTLLTEVPDNSIVLIEDIDSISIDVSKREDKSENNNVTTTACTNEASLLGSMFGLSFSSLLNAIDGIHDDVGKILFLTTNHIDKLDDALLRPGRIDLKLELGYVNDETARQLFDKFFYGYDLPEDEIAVRDGFTPADFQNLVLTGKSPEEILDCIEEHSTLKRIVSKNKPYIIRKAGQEG